MTRIKAGFVTNLNLGRGIRYRSPEKLQISSVGFHGLIWSLCNRKKLLEQDSYKSKGINFSF